MKNWKERAIGSLVVFIVIFFASSPLIQYFDAYITAIVYLAAVIGAGCYWIGSNPR